MVKRTANMPDNEPEEGSFDKPSETQHLFQVVEVFDANNHPPKLILDEDTVSVKCEVVDGEEAGRTLLHRLTLQEKNKGFFATRMFLKAIGEPYKGPGIEIDTERWQARQFWGVVIHNDGYANIDAYNYEKALPTVAWDDNMK